MLNIDHIRDIISGIDEDVLTLYLNVNPADRTNQGDPPGWRIYIKNALKTVEEHADKEACDQIEEQIDNYFDGFDSFGGSLVMFVGQNTFHTHQVPVNLENRHAYGEAMVVPLLWALDEYERYLVVLVDQERARFLSAFLGDTDAGEQMTIDFEAYDFGDHNYINNRGGNGVAFGGAVSQGASRDKFDDMHDAHLHRFYKDVAENIREKMKEMEVDRLVLGGAEKSAHAVKEELHESIQPSVVSILAVPVDVDESEVAEHIQDSALNFERSHEMELVEEVINFAKARGRGALGEEDVRKAMQMQMVELLVVPYPPEENEDSDLASEMTMEALKLGAKVELVHGTPAIKLKHEGNIAARLYYYIDGEEEASNT